MNYFRFLLLIVLLFSVTFPLHASAEDYDLYIAQGIQKINEGKMKDALEFLKKALELSPENPEATYYAGIAHSRVGNYKEAEGLFLKTFRLDETAIDVYLELGRLYYLISRCDKTAESLSIFIELSEDKALMGYAARLIESCTGKAEEKPYKLNITLGGQYDSNVIIEPENPIVSADKKSDFRVIVYLMAGATPLKSRLINLKVDYNFYQSIHTDLSDFNVHYHKITPELEMVLSDIIKPSVGYTFEYTLFGGDRYSRVHTYFGKVALKEGEKLSTEAIYEYSDRNYWDTDLYQTNSIRSGFLTSLGLRQNFVLERLRGNVYFFSDHDRTEENYWSLNGYRAGATLLYRVSSPLYVNISGEYNRRQYREDYPGYTEKRSDRMQQYSIGLTYLISKRISIAVTENYTINSSNLDIFDYKRNTTGVFLKVGVL